MENAQHEIEWFNNNMDKYLSYRLISLSFILVFQKAGALSGAANLIDITNNDILIMKDARK